MMQQKQSTTYGKNPTETGFPDGTGGGSEGSGIVNYDETKLQTAGTIVFHLSSLWRANGDNPPNTSFAEGTTGSGQQNSERGCGSGYPAKHPGSCN